MPLSGTSRWFLSAAQANLGVAGALVLIDRQSGVLSDQWNVLVWLLLVGFFGCTTLGFSLHLFPAVARRRLPRDPLRGAAFVLMEASVALGAYALYEAGSLPARGSLFSLAAALMVIAVAVTLQSLLRAVAGPRVTGPSPETRAGDFVTVPLFLLSWSAALGSGVLFALSGLWVGPGFGWWLAAVHLFVLGHATVLVAAVLLRFVPRSVDRDPPHAAVFGVAILGGLGGVLVPVGMLLVPPRPMVLLLALAGPEAAFAAVLFGLLIYLASRAKAPRRQVGLSLSAVGFLLIGGAIGLGMVADLNSQPVISHALINVLGFLGLTILVMWFGMIAPFQRISHAWTRRMLWAIAGVWLVAVVVLAAVGALAGAPPTWGPALGGALLLGVAAAWGAGTIPVLFPSVNPLPGLTSERIRVLRDRWSRR